jgi:hypothetical protein
MVGLQLQYTKPPQLSGNTMHARLRQRLAEAKLPGTRIVCLSVLVYLITHKHRSGALKILSDFVTLSFSYFRKQLEMTWYLALPLL